MVKPPDIGAGEAPARTAESVTASLRPTIGDNVPDNQPIPVRSLMRSDFRGEEFRRVIAQHGKRLRWRRAMACVCRSELTSQPMVNCPKCAGKGIRYVEAHDIRAVILQHDAKTKIFEKFGTWVEGLAQVTVEPEYRLAFRDSLEMIDGLGAHYELFVKGDRKGRRSRLPVSEDIGRYRIYEVTRMFAMAHDGSELIAEKDVHYTITQEGRIRWTPEGNRRYRDGTVVSIRYDYHPVYMVVHQPHATRDDINGTKVPQSESVALPLLAGVQLDWLVDAAEDRQNPGNPPTFTATTGEL